VELHQGSKRNSKLLTEVEYVAATGFTFIPANALPLGAGSIERRWTLQDRVPVEGSVRAFLWTAEMVELIIMRSAMDQKTIDKLSQNPKLIAKLFHSGVLDDQAMKKIIVHLTRGQLRKFDKEMERLSTVRPNIADWQDAFAVRSEEVGKDETSVDEELTEAELADLGIPIPKCVE
jgi:hypothetical protein